MRLPSLRGLFAGVLAMTLHATVLAAQISAAGAFGTFLSVAATTGQPVSALRSLWPYPFDARGETQNDWQITAAHRISIFLSKDGADVRVTSVRWQESAPDTVALRQRVMERVGSLERIAGPVELCGDPFGGPAHLFAQQHVERVWRRGISGAPTELSWDVVPPSGYTIAIVVGLFPDNRRPLRSCTSKSP